jgi:hypothetical protein
MSSTTVQDAILAAREAYDALLTLKALAEDAAQKIHRAELEAIGLAIRTPTQNSALRVLHDVAQSLQTSEIENAVAEARNKTTRVVAIGG